MMVPMAYELKRSVARQRNRFRYADEIGGIVTAPIYLFPDQGQFDADNVERLVQEHFTGLPLALPHGHVLFEVSNRSPEIGSIVVYAVAAQDRIDGYLFLRERIRPVWTDVIGRATFLPGLVADVELHPQVADKDNAKRYCDALTGMVWRAIALLARASAIENHAVPLTRRPKLAKHGVTGWSYRVVAIDPVRVRSAVALRDGTHASPRWHVRRGHWRTLADGRRVFVRECEVRDPAHGGVVKDYHVGLRGAA